ncbi:MAG: shikimate kinase [Alphaproteobacteria bacterium]
MSETRKSYGGLPLDKPICLVGMMGAGKSSIGKRLAARLGVDFVDADAEIEAAAGQSVSSIFEKLGEESFRYGERRVIDRLLSGGVRVIATGGGAFVDEQTRQKIKEKSISVWLRADIEVLVSRTARSTDKRPLLKKGDPRQIIEELLEKRTPFYAEADIVVESQDRPRDETLQVVYDSLRNHLSNIADTTKLAEDNVVSSDDTQTALACG